MKKIVLLFVLILGTQLGYAQDPMLQNDNPKFEKEAQSLTEKYNAELSLTTKQEVLFQKKIEEFLIKAADIRATYEGKEQLDYLYSLRTNEIAEMRDILTAPQFDRYKVLHSKLQPLATVEK